ncbi:WXG100 family type VII secretion target [Actinophytocola oryzae]|uniref:WXG100 family type VII secretion target n=1 Tax=Actinophytocola oryzae TaxID=502181 RepID=A0A4R7VS37_9PSEU|nr:WXG100 family type VII secretion target [Actinophytocola oryzae]TDV52037.1 hypothetical protein CLV71_105168 [Actinophytocola oryzae]
MNGHERKVVHRFDFELATQTLDEMHAVNGRVRQALADLQAGVEAGLHEWSSPALDAYWRAKAEWQRRANELPTQLEAGRRTLLSISDDHGTLAHRTALIWANSRG